MTCQHSRRRVVENKHSNRDRSLSVLQRECSYRRAEAEEEFFNISRVLVLNKPLGEDQEEEDQEEQEEEEKENEEEEEEEE